MWLHKDPQAFFSQSWQTTFSGVLFSAESESGVCQAVSLMVLIVSDKIQDGCQYSKNTYFEELLQIHDISRDAAYWKWSKNVYIGIRICKGIFVFTYIIILCCENPRWPPF